MKKTTCYLLFIFVSMLFACEKDAGTPPNLAFKTGATYTSADAIVAKNTAFTVGIASTPSESGDVLKTLNISYIYDGASTATTFKNVGLSGSQGENYSEDFGLTTRNQAGTEKWIFTITNRDGITNQISFTLTVK